MKPNANFTDDGSFDRKAAESAVETVMSELGMSGDVTESVEEGVVAYILDDMPDYQEIREKLDARGFDVAAVFPCKWEVYDADEGGYFDERVVAVCFEVPGLDPDNANSDWSNAWMKGMTPEEIAAELADETPAHAAQALC